MGLLRKTQRTHKAVPNQADKCSEPFDLEDGMLVEIYFEGRWQLKLLRETNGGFYGTGIGGNVDNSFVSKPTDYPIRRLTKRSIDKAKAYYEECIQYQQDLIDHRMEKERIAELQDMVTDLLKKDPEAKSRPSKAQ